MMKILLCIFCVYIAGTSLSFAKTELSKAAILEDSGELQRLLVKYHPNLNSHKSTSQLVEIWQEAEALLPPKPKLADAAALFQKMLAAICDEHTSIFTRNRNKPWGIEGSKFLPFGLVVVGEKLYIDGDDYSKERKIIVSINDAKSAEIVSFLKSVTHVDGCVKTDTLLSNLSDINIVHSLVANFVGDTTKFVIELLDPVSGEISILERDGTSLRKFVNSQNYKELHGISEQLKSVGIEVSAHKLKRVLSMKDDLLIGYSNDNSIAYVLTSIFAGTSKQDQAFDRELRSLIKRNPKNVIIDLTSNTGGALNGAKWFLSYFLNTNSKLQKQYRSKIKKPISEKSLTWNSNDNKRLHQREVRYFRNAGRYDKRLSQYIAPSNLRRSFGHPSYNGKLFVLISPQSYSVALPVAAELKRKAGASIIGNAGNVSMQTGCFASPGQFTLKNTKIQFLMPLVCVDYESNVATKGNLLEPTVLIDLDAQNSASFNAAALKAALELIEDGQQ